MRNFDKRIERIEKAIDATKERLSEEEGKRELEEFRRTAPVWLKEVLAMFIYLTDELADVESCRNPEKWKGVIEQNPNFSLRGNLSTFLCGELSHIHKDVGKAIEELPPEELNKVDRAKVKAEFQRVLSESVNLSDQNRDDLIKILSNPHNKYHNTFRRVLGLPPLEPEEGPEWKFGEEGWWHTGGTPPC